MQRPQRSTQLPLRYREFSPLRPLHRNSEFKRRRIDPEKIDRNDVDQALTVIVAAPKYNEEPSTLILTELPQFVSNYIENRPGCFQYTGLSELGFFKLFFSDSIIKILLEETSAYVTF
jgi:hypothetical protein